MRGHNPMYVTIGMSESDRAILVKALNKVLAMVCDSELSPNDRCAVDFVEELTQELEKA